MQDFAVIPSTCDVNNCCRCVAIVKSGISHIAFSLHVCHKLPEELIPTTLQRIRGLRQSSHDRLRNRYFLPLLLTHHQALDVIILSLLTTHVERTRFAVKDQEFRLWT